MTLCATCALRPARFKAATWNVFYGTAPATLRIIVRSLRKSGVSLFLLQEISNPEARKVFEREGLRLAFAPRQYGVAFDPEIWEVEEAADHVRLAEDGYYQAGGKTEVFSDAVRVILRHKASGKTVDALSYHTPPHVQVAPGERPPRRITTLRQSMATLKRFANEDRADAVLYGGDDNVDEKRRYAAFFAFMGDRATGLRQVQAPAPTHGHRTKGRRIDDFRVRGLKVGAGSVRAGGGDHRVHVREFTFA